jgi:hypothetical protein
MSLTPQEEAQATQVAEAILDSFIESGAPARVARRAVERLHASMLSTNLVFAVMGFENPSD